MEKLYPVRGSGVTAGAVLGVADCTVEHWLSNGKLTRTKIGRRTMIKESELLRFIDAGGSEPSPGGARRRSPITAPEVAK
jgi:excisionase family DNA binding protein